MPNLKPLALLNRSLIATTILAALIVAATFWLGSRNKDDDRWVVHSLGVRDQLTRVLSLVQSAETGQRGYLLTGQDIYLTPYRMAIEQLPPMLDKTGEQVADNSEQVQNLNRLRVLIRSKLDEMHSTLDAYSTGRKDDALAIVNSDSGYDLMLQIRRAVAAMQAAEDNLLVGRQSAAESSSTLLQVGVAAAFLLICGVGFLIARFTKEHFATLVTINDQLVTTNQQLREAG